jgi:two-component system sensor histidine kinase CpxA
MMGRLFWKIFLWFWLALALLNIAVGWGVKIYFEQSLGFDSKSLQTQVATIALAFEQGNKEKATQLLDDMTRGNKLPLFVVDEQGRDVLSRPLPRMLRHSIRSGNLDTTRLYTAQAQLPSGEIYHVVAPQKPIFRKYRTHTPIWLGFSITLVISTLVCYWLARYLSSPIRRLSHATRQLAEGNLNVRVGKIRRRDEIADLAQDFDVMAGKIQHLLGAQKQLLQDISHELRSPLARLQVALALARRNNSEHQEDYDRLGKDLDRLEQLIGEVLTLSSLETITYPTESVDLSSLVAAIVDDCDLEAKQKSCTINASVESAISLTGSRELLHRAVENILRNAIKFSSPNSSVEISLQKSRAGIEISVGDRGCGVPEESLTTMFEPFVRIDQARQHKPGGYGLGLAIASKAVALHKGNIFAENRDEGGLLVTIHLPQERIETV